MLLQGFTSASNGMQSLIEMNDLTANNLANVNTVGFKKASLIFKNIYDNNIVQKDAQTNEMQSIGELSVGSQVQKLTYDFSQGALSSTGSPFDLAIEGDGFFKIQSANGDVSYTRNGSFTLNNQSYLVTKEGDYVLDAEGGRVRIDTNGVDLNSNDDILVNEQGQILLNSQANQVALQTIGVYDFSNKEDMECIGGSKFRPTDIATNPELKATKFVVQQGKLEMSNANVINEMINTINTSRNYEALSKLVKEDGDSLSKVLQVGRIRSL